MSNDHPLLYRKSLSRLLVTLVARIKHNLGHASQSETNPQRQLEVERRFESKLSGRSVIAKVILSGVIVMALVISHHLLYRSLAGTAVTAGSFAVGRRSIGSQLWTKFLGTALATLVKYGFVYAISIAFTQVLWEKMRKGRFTVKQLSLIMEWKGGPFAPESLRQISKAFWVFFLALLGACMDILPVFVPGALNIVTSNFTLARPCIVSIVELLWTDIAVGGLNVSFSLPPMRALATRVLMLGSYIPPLNPCGICSYGVTFAAPAFQCKNITPSYDFAAAFPSYRRDRVMFWNATYAFGDTGLDFRAAWQSEWGPEISPTFQNAIQCVASNTTYHVNVTHDVTGSTVKILDRVDNNPLSSLTNIPGDYNLLAVMDAVAVVLAGTVTYGGAFQFDASSNLVGYAFGNLRDSSWTWNNDPSIAVPKLMENVSLSLLAGNVSVNRGFKSLRDVNETCYHSGLVYNYEWMLLVLPYGVGLVTILGCLEVGRHSRRQNGRWEPLDFTRLVDAISSESMMRLVTGRMKPVEPPTLQVSTKDPTNGQFQVAEDNS